jgi:hypothetical protein
VAWPKAAGETAALTAAREKGRAGQEEAGRKAGGSWANGLKAKKEMENVFFFSSFSKEFQIDFKFFF